MKTLSLIAALKALRDEPLWGLLAADKGPAYIALLHSLLMDQEKVLLSSALHERLDRELDLLRAHGHDLPQTAQAYVADWVVRGWLTRRFPPGATEEEFALTAEASSGVRFITGVLKPRVKATESRLATVIERLLRLAEETDANLKSRMEALYAERDRIDRELQSIERNGVRTLRDDRAVERAREIIALADELGADFRKVREQFDKLNRELRQNLVENEGSRGAVLEQLFAGVDLIGESEAGRTFNAFWRLLTDAEQWANLFESVDAVLGRPFARALEVPERKFLQNLTGMLMEEGGAVHEVLQAFARGLKTFVQSREFLEQRRLHTLLRQAQQAALALRESLNPSQMLTFSLSLTSSRIRSASQVALHDPSLRAVDATMSSAATAEITLDDVAEWVRQSEIDFRSLRANVRAILAERSQASVGQLLTRFPAEQGLGTVVGYIFLGTKHGEITSTPEAVAWRGLDGIERRAVAPCIIFLRERLHELRG